MDQAADQEAKEVLFGRIVEEQPTSPRNEKIQELIDFTKRKPEIIRKKTNINPNLGQCWNTSPEKAP